jgi:hypothetical protein
MLKLPYFFAIAALGLLASTDAAIGPIADLKIVNEVIAPDGFNRSCVFYFPMEDVNSSIIQDGPGWGNIPRTTHTRKQSISSTSLISCVADFGWNQGTRFLINVIDLLTDNTMERSTSIVSPFCSNCVYFL